MDKWEQVARDHLGIPATVNWPGVAKLATLLRHLEEGTIKRCADVAAAEANYDDMRQDISVKAACNRIESAILSLLPEEPDQ